MIDASSRDGFGIGGGADGGHADITLVGGSVNATVSDPAKDASGNKTYMLKVENSSGNDVIVDGSSYQRHSTDDPNVYVWLTEGSHTVNGVAANYAASSGRLKYAPQENDFTYTIPKDITYNATPQPATVTLKDNLPYSGSNAFAKYYADKENGTKDAPVNAGTYTVKACMDETEDHIAVEYEAGTFTIAPATPALTWNETSKDVYYTGSMIAKSQLSGAVTVGLLGKDTYSGENSYSYRAVKDGKSAGDFSEGLPTDPGTYELKAAIPASDNYTAAQTTATMTLTIRYLDGTEIPDATVANIADEWCPANGCLQAPTGYQICATPNGAYEETCAYALGEDQDTLTYYLQKADTKEIAKKSMTIKVDRTAPDWKGDNTGIQIQSKWWNSLLSSLTFGFYKGDQIDVSVKANDGQSGVDAYYYYVDRVDQSGSTAVKTANELAKCSFQEVTAGADQTDAVTLPSLSDDGRYVVYAYAVDAVGNRSAYICSDGVVLDRVAPKLEGMAALSKELRDTTAEISFTGSEAGTYFYVIKKDDEEAPTTMDDFATKTSGANVDSWQAKSGVSTGKLTAGENRIKLDKLAPNTAYVLYLAAVDEAGNASVANAEDIVSVPFTTLKTIPYVETAPVISGTYGQKLSEMMDDKNAKVVASQGSEDAVPGTWSIQPEDASQIPVVAATDTYTSIFTPAAGSAYESVSCEVTPQVAKKPVTVVIADAERSYGEESSKFTWTLAEGSSYVGNDSESELGIRLSTAATAQSDVGEYAITGVSDSVKYDVTFSGAHEDGKSGVLKVTQAENAFTTALSCAGYVYEKGRTPEPAAIAKYGTVMYKYTTIGTDGIIPADAVYTTDAPVNVGKYAVKAYVDGTDNYKGLESDAVPFTITKAAHPSNMPGSTMSAAYSQAKVSAVPLPSGWTWSDADRDKELSVGAAVTAGAIYTDQDQANYEQTELTITITRLAQVTPGSSGGSGGGSAGGSVTPGRTDDSGKEDTPDPTPDTPADQPMPQPSGTKVKDASGASYQVTGTGGKTPTVRYAAPKSKTGRTVKIPASVKINGVSYKVTSIAANAFKNNKKVQKIEIGKNIVSIGKKAFANCKNLKTITISSMNLTDETISEDAFSGISADVTIKVPKSKYKEYKKLLRKKGLSKKVRIKKY